MTTPSYELKNHTLFINGTRFSLDAYVSKVIPIDSYLAVKIGYLLDNPTTTPPRNVFLLDDAGKIIWQIEEFKFGDRPEYFSNIWLNDKGQLMAFVPKGFEFVIDMKTGKLTEEEFVR